MESATKNEKNGMFFVDLKETQSDGSAWTTEAQEKLTKKWNSLLRTNSLQANIFSIEPKKLLFSVDKGWFMSEIVDFVRAQPEVESIVKDSKHIKPKSGGDDDDDL